MKTNYVYVTKCINKDMTSRHDGKFLYPPKGIVTAPDWNDTPECGGGIHGFLWGEGEGSLADYSDNSVWLLIKVNPSDGLIVMDDKCKFRQGKVILVSDYQTVAKEILKYLPNDRLYRVIGVVITGGDYSTLTGGDGSTLTGGDGSTLTGGDYSTLTGGDGSTLTGGDYSTLTGGDGSTLTGGDGSTLTGGDYSTVTGGMDSVIIITYWDTSKETYKRKVGVIGENGLKPNVKYRLDDIREFVEAE